MSSSERNTQVHVSLNFKRSFRLLCFRRPWFFLPFLSIRFSWFFHLFLGDSALPLFSRRPMSQSSVLFPRTSWSPSWCFCPSWTAAVPEECELESSTSAPSQINTLGKGVSLSLPDWLHSPSALLQHQSSCSSICCGRIPTRWRSYSPTRTALFRTSSISRGRVVTAPLSRHNSGPLWNLATFAKMLWTSSRRCQCWCLGHEQCRFEWVCASMSVRIITMFMLLPTFVSARGSVSVPMSGKLYTSVPMSIFNVTSISLSMRKSSPISVLNFHVNVTMSPFVSSRSLCQWLSMSISMSVAVSMSISMSKSKSKSKKSKSKCQNSKIKSVSQCHLHCQCRVKQGLTTRFPVAMWRRLFRIFPHISYRWCVARLLSAGKTSYKTRLWRIGKRGLRTNMTKSEAQAVTCGQGSRKERSCERSPGRKQARTFRTVGTWRLTSEGQEPAEERCPPPMDQQSQPCSNWTRRRVERTIERKSVLLSTEAPEADAKYTMECWSKSPDLHKEGPPASHEAPALHTALIKRKHTNRANDLYVTGRAGVDGPSAKNGEVPPEDRTQIILTTKGGWVDARVAQGRTHPDRNFLKESLSTWLHASMICAVAASSPWYDEYLREWLWLRQGNDIRRRRHQARKLKLVAEFITVPKLHSVWVVRMVCWLANGDSAGSSAHAKMRLQSDVAQSGVEMDRHFEAHEVLRRTGLGENSVSVADWGEDFAHARRQDCNLVGSLWLGKKAPPIKEIYFAEGFDPGEQLRHEDIRGST